MAIYEEKNQQYERERETDGEQNGERKSIALLLLTLLGVL